MGTVPGHGSKCTEIILLILLELVVYFSVFITTHPSFVEGA